MDLAWVPDAIEALTRSGPAAAIVVGILVGLGLLVVVVARFGGLFAAGKTELQGVAFQDRLLGAVDRLVASEDALRRRIDILTADRVAQAEEIAELRASLALLRNQRRRLIELLRDIKEGRIQSRAPAPRSIAS